MEKEITAINKWVFFCNNYPSDFIEKTWEGDSSLIAHLKGKFEYLYKWHGSYGVMHAFYGELSWSNRVKLMEWVMEPSLHAFPRLSKSSTAHLLSHEMFSTALGNFNSLLWTS